MASSHQKVRLQRWLIPPAILFVIIIIAFLVVFLTTCYQSKEGCFKIMSIESSDLAGFLLNALVVIALGVALMIEQKRFTEDIAERQEYSTAIEHLSSSNPAVRLKGVQALYGRARSSDSATKREIWSLLNDHVRHYTQDTNYQRNFSKEPSIDIQEAIDIQGHRGKYKDSRTFLDVGLEAGINWNGAWLRSAELSEARLQDASLTGVRLQGANLLKAQLRRAILTGARLQGATLCEAQLQEATLVATGLQGAWLIDAQLQGADLGGAKLQSAWLTKAQLQGASLQSAQLLGASLYSAQLQGADLAGAQLQGVALGKTQLQGANLWRSQLQGADLIEAQLQGANLWKAQLQEANLWRSQLQGSYGSEDRFKPFGKGLGDRSMAFRKRLEGRAGEDANLDNMVLRGGLTKYDVEKIRDEIDLNKKYLSDGLKEELDDLLLRLEYEHCEEKISGSSKQGRRMLISKDVDAALGSYSKEEAEQWIREFNETVRRGNSTND